MDKFHDQHHQPDGDANETTQAALLGNGTFHSASDDERISSPTAPLSPSEVFSHFANDLQDAYNTEFADDMESGESILVQLDSRFKQLFGARVRFNVRCPPSLDCKTLRTDFAKVFGRLHYAYS